VVGWQADKNPPTSRDRLVGGGASGPDGSRWAGKEAPPTSHRDSLVVMVQEVVGWCTGKEEPPRSRDDSLVVVVGWWLAGRKIQAIAPPHNEETPKWPLGTKDKPTTQP
jgi:hypothetical protein